MEVGQQNAPGVSTALEKAYKTHTHLSQKVIRVFFSSPFGGLELEREQLTKNYWPQLQTLCSHHGYTFVPVDLRWGITTEHSASASTINICLNEIDRSDIFVGFFGQRYGWHGDEKLLQQTFDVAQAKYPWLAGHRGKAVTELEFLHGHLMNPGSRPACFYFRNKAYDDKMYARYKEEGNEREMRKFRSSTDGPHASELLEDLKKRVYSTRDKCIDVCMSYETPQQAAKMMSDAIDGEIKRMLTTVAEVNVSPREIEKAKHDAYFVNQYAMGGKYVGGDEYVHKIDELTSGLDAKDTRTQVAIVGSAGSGKTALLCNWIDCHSRKCPEDIVVYHFIGCATDTTDPQQVLSRVYSELKYEFERKSEPVSDEDKNVKVETGKPEEEVKMEAGEVNDEEHAMSDRKRKSPSSLMAFFSCLRGNKIAAADNDEMYERPEPETEEGKSEQSPAREEAPEQKQSSVAIGNQTSETEFSPKRHFPEGDGEGDQSIQKLLANIDELTQKISEEKRKVYLVIDALNKTDDLGKTGKILFWLPKNLPPHIHIIVSTRTEDAASVKVLIEEHSFETLHVSCLGDAERETLGRNMLALRGKEFSDKQMAKMLANEQTRNPLYLKIFLEEMCNFGDFFHLDKHIEHLLNAKSTQILFLKFIERMEMDYNQNTANNDGDGDGDEKTSSDNVVRDILCLIEISHEGLSEDELRSVLHIDSHIWSPIFFAMASFLIDRGGLYSFAYEDLSEAVKEYYLESDADRLMFVQKLADYFENRLQSLSLLVDDTVPSRISCELPRLLVQLNDTEKLAGYLSKLCVMACVVSDSPAWFSMMEHWAVTKYSNGQISEAFLTSIDEDVTRLKERDVVRSVQAKNPVVAHEKLLPVVLRISQFMVDAGFGKAAIPILIKAKQLYDSVEDTCGDLEFVELYCDINSQLACLYVDLDMLDDAEPLHKQVLDVRQRYSKQFFKGETNVATSLHGLAVLYEKRKDYEKVNEYNQEILDIYQRELSPMHEYFANLYNNWGVAVMLSNSSHDAEIYKKATDYLYKAQTIYESVYFGHLPPQVTVTLNNLALCYRRQGQHEEARKIYKRVLDIRVETLGDNHVNVGMIYRNLGTLEYSEEKFDLALDYYTKSLKIYQEFGGEDHIETALSLENMALANLSLQRWDEAHKYFNEAGEILHRTDKMNYSLASLNYNMVEYYLTNGREKDAYKLFERLVGTSIATPRDYVALEYFDHELPENERPVRPFEHTTEYALQKWPDNEMLLRNKIKYCADPGDIDKLMQYLRHSNCSADIFVAAYASFVEKGHVAIAMPLLTEGLKNYPDNQLLLRNMVELSLAFKDNDKVIECATKLLNLDPSELFALIFLGRAQALSGNVADAKQIFSKGLSLAQQANDEENTAKFQNFLQMLENITQ